MQGGGWLGLGPATQSAGHHRTSLSLGFLLHKWGSQQHLPRGLWQSLRTRSGLAFSAHGLQGDGRVETQAWLQVLPLLLLHSPPSSAARNALLFPLGLYPTLILAEPLAACPQASLIRSQVPLSIFRRAGDTGDPPSHAGSRIDLRVWGRGRRMCSRAGFWEGVHSGPGGRAGSPSLAARPEDITPPLWAVFSSLQALPPRAPRRKK